MMDGTTASGREVFDRFDAVGVVAANSIEFVETMLSNLEQGRVSILLRSSDDQERLTISGADDVITPGEEKGWLRRAFRSIGGGAPAQISFTSGTQGAPKAVLLSRGALHDVVARLNAAMALTEEVREYVGVPVYHSFGYGRCRSVLNAGGALFIPSNGFDLSEIRRMAQAGEINAISAVPTQWRLFLEHADMFGEELRNIRWVEIGSQPMSAVEKDSLRKALPNARIIQHYGLTEASRTTLLQIDGASAEMLESVGRPLGGVAVRINQRGRIEIRGPHVALGVFDGEAYKALGDSVWLETSDRGHIESGNLIFEGRADDIINVGGVKLSPDLIETYIHKELPACGEFGIVRCSDPLRGDGVCLALTPSSRERRENILHLIDSYAESLGAAIAGALSVCEVDALPRTETGKLRRAALAEMVPGSEDEAEGTIAHGSYAQAFKAAVMPRSFKGEIGPGVTFHDFDADSLAHIQATLILERALGEAPLGWETTPIAELIERLEAADENGSLEAHSTGAPPLPDGSKNMNPDDISFWALVREDFRANGSKLSQQGFLMLLVHRFGNWRMSVRPRLLRAPLSLLYRFMNKCTQLFFGMKLDYTVKVGRRVRLEHFGGMILGAREIGNDVIIRQNTTFGIRSTADLNAKPVIGNYVDIGAGAVIVGNIRIGDNCVIGANSVVYTSVPDDSVVMGVPAKIIGKNENRNPSPLPGWPSAQARNQ